MEPLVAWAQAEARSRLERLGNRWLHSEAVALRASQVSLVCEPADRPLLIAAALLHDVGYSPELAATGFHPLDGARWLATQGPQRLAGLVAHHTGARYEADELGLRSALDEFPDEASAVSDALTYCDLTTGPRGERITAVARLTEIERRYGQDSAVVRALKQAAASLSSMVDRTEQRLDRARVI